jgi:Flp pilus assembly protein TadD
MANADPLAEPGRQAPDAHVGFAAAFGGAQKDPLGSEFALARLCERRGETKEAERIYRALLRWAPKDARLYHRLGMLAVQKGNFPQAEEHFRKAKSLAPPTVELLSDIGYCYYLQLRLPEAEKALGDALTLDPTNAAALNNLALVMGRERRFEEALDLFKRSNNEPEAYANLAYVLAQNGERGRAKQVYLHALTLDNSMRAAAQAMLQVGNHAPADLRVAAAGVRPLPTKSPDGKPGPRLKKAGPDAVALPAPSPANDPGGRPEAAGKGTDVVLLDPPPTGESGRRPDGAPASSPQAISGSVEPCSAEVVVESSPASAVASPPASETPSEVGKDSQ